MAYIVNNSRGQIIAVIQDGTVNTTATSQTLVGKNVTPYGEYSVENIVHQLENFANSTPPGNPITGQIWYDTSINSLFVYSGTGWKTVGSATNSVSSPVVDPKIGDLWLDTSSNNLYVYATISTGFGWVAVNNVDVESSAPVANTTGQMYFNSSSKQLFIWDGLQWSLIGPDGLVGYGVTKWVSDTLPDTLSVDHAVMQGVVNGTTVAIATADTFTIAPGSAPPGFSSLVPGINMSSSTVLSGRATQADQLTTARNINGVPFNGTSNINVKLNYDLTPGLYISGSSFDGSSGQTWSVNATDLNTPNTVVARDSLGDFDARVITADLIGNVTGLATNVSGTVPYNKGGTGQTIYSAGQILVGNASGGLSLGTVIGSSPIQVTQDINNNFVISYVGGTGTGNVSSVGIITVGDGIGISGSPITSAGNITVTNTGVTRLNQGTGISVNTTNGNVTVTNTGVTSLNQGTGINVSATTGSVTVTNTGVTRIVAGSNITVSPPGGIGEVTISSTGGGGSSYTLPTATSTTLGGIKVGAGLAINAGVLSTSGVNQIIPGSGVSISPVSGTGAVTISANPGSYSLPIASGSTLGGVKIGSGLSINPTTGVLSASTGGGGTVYQVVAGTGLTGGTISTAGTIAVDSSVLRSNVAQTVSSLKTFTGGIISQAYNFSANGYSIFYVSPSQGTGDANAVQVAVNGIFPNYFYERRFVIEGSADYVSGERARGGAIVGVDNGTGGGAGVLGWHTQAQPGLGIGVLGVATNTAFTGDVIQSSAARSTSSGFDCFQAYSYSTGGSPVSLYQLRGDGNAYAAGSWISSGADYAEYFESDSGTELEVGTTVVLINNKVRNFQPGDDMNDIIGVVRPKINGVSAMVGNSAFNHWNKRYLTDDFGSYIMEPHMVYQWTEEVDGKTNYHSYESHCVPADVTIPPHAEVLTHDHDGKLFQHPKENPDFDPSVKYVPRENRPEWHVVGLLGQVPVKKGQPMHPSWKKMKNLSDVAEMWYIR